MTRPTQEAKLAELAKRKDRDAWIPLIYGFRREHSLRTVCGDPCEQCGGFTEMSAPGLGEDGKPKQIDSIPLFIVKEATYEEYLVSCRANGGIGSPAAGRFFYEVTTD